MTEIQIVVVEDNKSFNNMISKFLNDEFKAIDVKISSFLDPLEAFNCCESVDILVCDNVMPNWDGLKLVKELEKRQVEKKFYTILISVITNWAIVEEFDYIFHKPFIDSDFEKLKLIVEEIMDGLRQEVDRETFLENQRKRQRAIEESSEEILLHLDFRKNVKQKNFIQEIVNNFCMYVDQDRSIYSQLSKLTGRSISYIKKSLREFITANGLNKNSMTNIQFLKEVSKKIEDKIEEDDDGIEKNVENS